MVYDKEYHREYQYHRAREFRAYIASIKAYFGCSRCDGTKNLEFHHTDPEIKSTNVAWMSNSSLETLWIEIGKCDVLCKRCHMIKEHDFYAMSRLGTMAQWGKQSLNGG